MQIRILRTCERRGRSPIDCECSTSRTAACRWSIGRWQQRKQIDAYRCGHFGKDHLGDRNEHLPTAHGFDEFFGNLYHLNTQEQNEYRNYQAFAKKYPGGSDEFQRKFGTRVMLHSWATDTDDERPATARPRRRIKPCL